MDFPENFIQNLVGKMKQYIFIAFIFFSRLLSVTGQQNDLDALAATADSLYAIECAAIEHVLQTLQRHSHMSIYYPEDLTWEERLNIFWTHYQHSRSHIVDENTLHIRKNIIIIDDL